MDDSELMAQLQKMDFYLGGLPDTVEGKYLVFQKFIQWSLDYYTPLVHKPYVNGVTLSQD